MSDVADALRPLWLPGINAVNGPLYSTLSDWFNKGEYQIFRPLINNTSFCLQVTDAAAMTQAFAFDLDRLACASFESLLLADKSEMLPRSTGWSFIKSYYAAFFAAHSLMRLFKLSCTHVDSSVAKAVTKVAKLYGVDCGHAVSAGYYRCTFDWKSKQLSCDQISTGGGSHEAVWDTFAYHVKELSTDILRSGLKTTTQPLAAKLIELRSSLLQGKTSAGWLSNLRNRINYQQALGCWFPYVRSQRHDKRLFEEYQLWLRDPMDIPIEKDADLDLLQARRVCQFIAALCRVEVIDLSKRCPSGRSFCDTGSAALLKTDCPPTSFADLRASAPKVDNPKNLLYSSEVLAVSMICRGFSTWPPRTNRMLT